MENSENKDLKLQHINASIEELNKQIKHLTRELICENQTVTRHVTAQNEPYSILSLYYFPKRNSSLQREVLHKIIDDFINLEEAAERLTQERTLTG